MTFANFFLPVIRFSLSSIQASDDPIFWRLAFQCSKTFATLLLDSISPFCQPSSVTNLTAKHKLQLSSHRVHWQLRPPRCTPLHLWQFPSNDVAPTPQPTPRPRPHPTDRSSSSPREAQGSFWCRVGRLHSIIKVVYLPNTNLQEQTVSCSLAACGFWNSKKWRWKVQKNSERSRKHHFISSAPTKLDNTLSFWQFDRAKPRKGGCQWSTGIGKQEGCENSENKSANQHRKIICILFLNLK